MTIDRNNPAGRLYSILEKALQQNQNGSIKEALKTALEAMYLDDIEFTKRLIYFKELIEEVKDKIKSIEGINADLYLKYFSRIETIANTDNISALWKTISGLLDEATMYNLAHCAEALSKVYKGSPIEPDILLELDRELSDLFSKVGESGLDEQIKTVVLDQIETIRRSIAEYRIRGAEGMHKALAYCVGMYAVNLGLFEKNNDKEEVKSLRYVIGKTWTIVSSALEYLVLGFEVNRILVEYFKRS